MDYRINREKKEKSRVVRGFLFIGALVLCLMMVFLQTCALAETKVEFGRPCFYTGTHNSFPVYPSGGKHSGNDIQGPKYTAIFAVRSGSVRYSGKNSSISSFGNYVAITDGEYSQIGFIYAHLDSCVVSKGQKVEAGDLIGYMGATGNVTGVHLHLQAPWKGNAVSGWSDVNLNTCFKRNASYPNNAYRYQNGGISSDLAGGDQYNLVYNENRAPGGKLRAMFTYPSNFKTGSSWILKGAVVSPAKLTSVDLWIENSSGTRVAGMSSAKNPGSCFFDIHSVDSQVKMQNVSTNGTYYYCISAKDASGSTLSVRQAFTASGSATSNKNVKFESDTSSTSDTPENNDPSDESNKVTITESKVTNGVGSSGIPYGVPSGNLTKGKAFGLRGTITASEKIVKAVGGVYNFDKFKLFLLGDPALPEVTVTPNSTTLNIQYSKINDNLLFNKLEKGTYIYAVTVTTSSGYTKRCYLSGFTVDNASTASTLAEIAARLAEFLHEHQMTAHAKVEATKDREGTEAYWSCDTCGKLFSDAEGKNEISAPVVIPRLPSENPITAFVNRCYSLILNRSADAAGLQDWARQLENKTRTASEIIYGFMYSGEFTGRNLSHEDAVEILYQVMLNRASDAAGKATWVFNLSDGYDYVDIINGFCQSGEFKGLCETYKIEPGSVVLDNDDDKVAAFVKRCYRLILKRGADEEGLNTWVTSLKNGKQTASEIIYGFMYSSEYTGRGMSSSATVEILYRVMLNRGSDATGKTDWLNRLANGENVVAIINGFCGSQEFIGLCREYGIEPGSVKTEEATALTKAVKAVKKAPEAEAEEVGIAASVETEDLLGEAVQESVMDEEKAKEFVTRCYKAALDRDANEAELAGWVDQIVTGEKTPDRIVRGFLFSEEFRARNLSSEEIVKILYRIYMNREADPEGLAFWTGKLAEGMSLEDAVKGFAASEEFKAILKNMKK